MWLVCKWMAEHRHHIQNYLYFKDPHQKPEDTGRLELFRINRVIEICNVFHIIQERNTLLNDQNDRFIQIQSVAKQLVVIEEISTAIDIPTAVQILQHSEGKKRASVYRTSS